MKLTGTEDHAWWPSAPASTARGACGPRTSRWPGGVAKKMATAIEKADGDVVAGDCTLANGGIVLETGADPRPSDQFLARAYGIPEEGCLDLP